MNELYHHGIKGQRWGIRRYQNPDGTLTPAGKKRYDAREYDRQVADNYRSNKNSNNPFIRKQVKKDFAANTLSKILMRKSMSESYSAAVKNGSGKASAFVSRYAESYIRDLADYTAVSVGATIAGSLIAGPTGGLYAGILTAEVMQTAKSTARIVRTAKYLT